MQLTGKEIISKGIVLGADEKCIQQQGVDLRVKKISAVNEKAGGFIPEDGKSIIPPTLEAYKYDKSYILSPGYYEVEFTQGCDVPRDATLHIKTRSSLVRCGAICHSGQFDGGFKTKNMGCFLHVILPISIEPHARIAQALVFESNPVDDDKLYDGQWQGDKQRENK